MSIKIAVRKLDNKKVVQIGYGNAGHALWVSPAYARRLSSRLLVAANMAEIVIFSCHERDSDI